MVCKIDNVKLNNGDLMPCVGFGTSMVTGDECVNTILNALEVGYLHIDTAHVYENECEIGRALKLSGVKREDLFITSKVWKDSMGYENTMNSFNETLLNLGLDYLDLFLIHWPKNNDDALNIETWRALEDLYKAGKVKAIGVSNFLVKHLVPILENCEIMPMVNQIEFHPGLTRMDTVEFCKEKGIVVEAWSPLGKGRMLDNDVLNGLADKYGKSVAQLCLKWCVQNGVVPLPKSQNVERMKQNLEIFDFVISDEDMCVINNMRFFAGSTMDPNSFN